MVGLDKPRMQVVLLLWCGRFTRKGRGPEWPAQWHPSFKPCPVNPSWGNTSRHGTIHEHFPNSGLSAYHDIGNNLQTCRRKCWIRVHVLMEHATALKKDELPGKVSPWKDTWGPKPSEKAGTQQCTLCGFLVPTVHKYLRWFLQSRERIYWGSLVIL